MRAAIGPRLPLLAHFFGVHPWDVDRLSAREIRFYLDALDDLEQERKRADREHKKAQRRRR